MQLHTKLCERDTTTDADVLSAVDVELNIGDGFGPGTCGQRVLVVVQHPQLVAGMRFKCGNECAQGAERFT